MESHKELTAIEMAVRLSKIVLHLKILLERLRNTRSFMGAVPEIIFHTAKDDLDKSIEDVRYNLHHTEQRIALYLKPLLHGHEYEYPGKYSFTAKEMVKGYATVERILQKDKEGKVTRVIDMALLLSSHPDSSDVLNLSAGQIISFDGHKEILDTLPSVIDDTELQTFLKPNYTCTFNIDRLFPKS